MLVNLNFLKETNGCTSVGLCALAVGRDFRRNFVQLCHGEVDEW